MAEGESSSTPGPQVQYPAYAAAPYPPFPNVSGAQTQATVQVLPSRVVDFQSYVEPLQSPPNVAPVVPTGYAAYAAIYPDQTRRRTLPEMGTFALPTLTPQVSGGALSWVPVYSGKPGLRPALQPFSQVMNPPFVTSLTVPNQWASYYPDTTRRLPSGFPATLPALTWTPTTIAPPPPPTFTRNPFPNLYRRWFLFDMRN